MTHVVPARLRQPWEFTCPSASYAAIGIVAGAFLTRRHGGTEAQFQGPWLAGRNVILLERPGFLARQHPLRVSVPPCQKGTNYAANNQPR